MRKNIIEKKNNISIWKYLKNYKFGISMYLIVYALAATANIFITIFFAKSVEQITFKLYQKGIVTLLIAIGIYVVRRISWYTSGLIYNKYAYQIMSDLNIDLSKRAFKLTSKTYSDNDTGTFVQRIVNDPERIVSTLSDVVDLLSNTISSFIMVVYISFLNVYIGLALLTIILFCFVIEYFRSKALRKNQRVARKKGDKINSLTTEIVRSEKDIKALGLENSLSKVSSQYYIDYKKANAKRDVVNMNFYSTRNLIIEVFGGLLLVLGIYFIDIGTITLATYMIVYSNNGNLYSLIWGFGEIFTTIVEIKVCSERMFSIFDDEIFECEKFGKLSAPNLKGEIEFKNVGYSYVEYDNPYDDEDNLKRKKKDRVKLKKKVVSVNKIFDNLSFKIKPNTTVAFVGKSGSGKSTILNLMSKMYVVDEGEILIDGININDLDKQSLRSNISLVNQFPYIFDMTIKENLLLAKNNATDEEIYQALDKASLKEFIDSLPNKIDTKVGESGIKLSGGQKQRLAIARALLRNSSIIIFDESTSSLDNIAQNDIKKSIDGLKGKSTVVIVAHRLSTIKDADKIFFLDEGKIIDTGTFDELFSNNEKFRTMFLAENI